RMFSPKSTRWAFEGILMWSRGPTSVMRPSSTITTPFGMGSGVYKVEAKKAVWDIGFSCEKRRKQPRHERPSGRLRACATTSGGADAPVCSVEIRLDALESLHSDEAGHGLPCPAGRQPGASFPHYNSKAADTRFPAARKSS